MGIHSPEETHCRGNLRVLQLKLQAGSLRLGPPKCFCFPKLVSHGFHPPGLYQPRSDYVHMYCEDSFKYEPQ